MKIESRRLSVLAAVVLAGCAEAPVPEPVSPAVEPPVLERSETALNMRQIIETVAAIVGEADGDTSTEAVIAALNAAPPGPGPASAPIGLALGSESCDQIHWGSPIFRTMSPRLCPSESDRFRALYHDPHTLFNPEAGGLTAEDARRTLRRVGYVDSEPAQWPVPVHMPHPYVQTVLLPPDDGPVIVLHHSRSPPEAVDRVTLYWPER